MPPRPFHSVKKINGVWNLLSINTSQYYGDLEVKILHMKKKQQQSGRVRRERQQLITTTERIQNSIHELEKAARNVYNNALYTTTARAYRLFEGPTSVEVKNKVQF